MQAGPNGTIKEEEVQNEESQDLRSGIDHEEEVQLEIPHDLRRGG
jgi:hypothetical protein